MPPFCPSCSPFVLLPTYYFHVVNVALHGMVMTGLIAEATAFIFSDVMLQCVLGFIFGLHPVHAEVVSNITSRGELLMSMFMLTAFLSCASTIRNRDRKVMISYFLGVYIVPWLGMTLSLFSKEQGATTLILFVLWDFLTHHGNVLNLLQELKSKNGKAWKFVGHTIILAIETLAICFWRYMLNGKPRRISLKLKIPLALPRIGLHEPFRQLDLLFVRSRCHVALSSVSQLVGCFDSPHQQSDGPLRFPCGMFMVFCWHIALVHGGRCR